jgi:hypothetical protein
VALTVRRALARVAVATAATIAVITIVSRCESSASSRDIDVEVDLGLVQGLRSAQVELRRGTTVVAWAERDADSGLTGPLHLHGPPLGADGELRIRLETDDGPRLVRKPLTAAAGSTVTVRVGE